MKSKIFLLVFGLFFLFPFSSAIIDGYDGTGGLSTGFSGALLQCSSYTANYSAYVNTFHVQNKYPDAVNIKMGLYQNGTWKALSNQVSTTTGGSDKWYNLTLNSSFSDGLYSAGTIYICTLASNSFDISYTSTFPHNFSYEAISYPNFPDPPTLSYYSYRRLSMYVNSTIADPEQIPPEVVLVSPGDQDVIDHFGVVSFNSTMTDNLDLDNSTFYLWNSTGFLLNSSFDTLSGVSDSSQFEYNLTDEGSYFWNVLVFDNDSNSAWASANFTFNISIPPVFSLNITDPTSANQMEVSSGENVSILFLLLEDFVNITSSLSLLSVFVGGEEASVITSGSPGSQSYSFFEGFESGSIGANWSVYESDSGGVQEVSTTYKRSGSYGGILYRSPSGTYTLNELISEYDFTGASNIYLDFYWRDIGDETNNGADHSGHYNSDSVYFTCDGSYWYLLANLGSGSNDFNNHGQINVSADPDFCGSLDENFAIKFSQYDNYPPTSDGIALDDINISYVGSGQSSEFSWVDGLGWQANITLPSGLSGEQDLFVNVSYDDVVYNDTQSSAFVFGNVTDSCTCSNGQPWEIDMSDYCVLSSSCNPTAVTFINSGNFTCNAFLNASSVEGLDAGQRGYMGGSCLINIYW